jgi:hypothetical protein
MKVYLVIRNADVYHVASSLEGTLQFEEAYWEARKLSWETLLKAQRYSWKEHGLEYEGCFPKRSDYIFEVEVMEVDAIDLGCSFQ